jgi:uncharacterized protein (DUF1684 family)
MYIGGIAMTDASDATLASTASLWDWRRRVAALYAGVRAAGDPARAWAEWRRGRDALFLDHPQTPLPPAQRRPLAYFPYAKAFRFEVGLRPAAGGAPETIEAGRDGTVTLLPFALTQGLGVALGAELTLYWIAGYGGGVFLPFADATSGAATYAGGRYLLDTIKGADLGQTKGRVVLDFNFAYNPSCSYSDRWVCPLAPAANRLPTPVAAGERTFQAQPGLARRAH